MKDDLIEKLRQIRSAWDTSDYPSEPEFKLRLRKAESEFRAILPDLSKYLTNRPLRSQDREYINNLEKYISENKEYVYKLIEPIDQILFINEIIEYKEVMLDPDFTELSETEKEVINLRFGFSGKCLKLREIGKRFGISRERVRQIEERALEKIRDHISQSE